MKRNANDRARLSAGKRSVGPGRLDEMLSAVLAFALAFSSLNRENVVVVIGVAGNETAVIYPRKGGESSMADAVGAAEGVTRVDANRLHEGVSMGVAELVARSAAKVEKEGGKSNGDGASASASAKEDNGGADASDAGAGAGKNGAAVAAALSLALCCINRFMVASHGGVSAVASESLLRRGEDDGVLALLGGKKARRAAEEREERRRARGMLSPRVLIVQASDDRTADYNAFMNCAFAAIKGDVAIDGCFVLSGIAGHAKTSTFLEQACDRTAGVFLAPSGVAQVGGALTEVLMSVFLAPLSARKRLNLPALTKVDFRARCFETGESVDIANVCNQCLSIFKNRPKDFCPTCGAEVKKKIGKANLSDGGKRQKIG